MYCCGIDDCPGICYNIREALKMQSQKGLSFPVFLAASFAAVLAATSLICCAPPTLAAAAPPWLPSMWQPGR